MMYRVRSVAGRTGTGARDWGNNERDPPHNRFVDLPFLTSAPASARQGGKSIDVGPIWYQMDADRKCPEAARKAGWTWTGQWRNTRPGQMSECDIKR